MSEPHESFEVVAMDSRMLLAAFRRVSELDAEEDWAFLSGGRSEALKKAFLLTLATRTFPGG